MNALRYRFLSSLLLSLLSSIALAASEPIVFKQAFSPRISWFTYGAVIVLLLGIVLAVAKKQKPGSTKKSACTIIEKTYLGNKTVVYVIDYQRQRFLLADNQHSLVLHSLIPENTNEQM